MAQPSKRRTSIWHPLDLNVNAAYALQAMARGEAIDSQQKMVVEWLINNVCQTYEDPFQPDNTRITDYVLGRRSVGLAIVKHLNARPKPQ